MHSSVKRPEDLPERFEFLCEAVEYNTDGTPSGWMNDVWVDPVEKIWNSRTIRTSLGRELTPEEVAAILPRASNGTVRGEKPHPVTYTLKFSPYTVDQMQKIERAVAKLKQMPGYVEE